MSFLTSHMPSGSIFNTAALAAWGTRGVTMGAQLMALRVATTDLVPKDFSIWAMLGNIYAWTTLCDLGWGQAMQNEVASERARGGDPRTFLRTCARRLVQYYAVLGASVTSLVLLWVVVTAGARDQWVAHEALGLAVVVGLGSVPSSVAQRVLLACGKPLWSYTLACAAPAGTLLGFTAAKAVDATVGLRVICLISLGPPAVIGLTVAIYVARVWGSGRAPQSGGGLPIAKAERGLPPGVRRRAREFLGFSALACAITQIDYIILQSVASAADIARYSIVSRIWVAAYLLFNAFLVSQQVEITRCVAVRDVPYVLRLRMSYLRFGLIYCLCCGAVFMFVIPLVAKVIIPGYDDVATGLVVVWMIHYLIRVWCDVHGLILLGAGEASRMIVPLAMQALIAAPAQLYLTRALGSVGVPIALSLSLVATMVWMLPAASARITQTGGTPLPHHEPNH